MFASSSVPQLQDSNEPTTPDQPPPPPDKSSFTHTSLTEMIKKIVTQPVFSLGLSVLGLLLLVFVLLSVPGPIKTLYWFSAPIDRNGTISELKGGVSGWCWDSTANCTYSALSNNEYLAKNFNVGTAFTVGALVPMSCYWTIVCMITWVLLTVLAPIGYSIKGTEFISRHLYFNIVEVSVLCMQLFGCVLTWLAYGFMNYAFRQMNKGIDNLKMGTAMPTVAIAATISLVGFFLGAWGLHLRIRESQAVWEREAMAFRGPGGPRPASVNRRDSVIGNFRATSMMDEKRGSGMYSLSEHGGHQASVIPASHGAVEHLAVPGEGELEGGQTYVVASRV